MSKEEMDRIAEASRREYGAMIAKAEEEGLIPKASLRDCFVGYCDDSEIDHTEVKYY